MRHTASIPTKRSWHVASLAFSSSFSSTIEVTGGTWQEKHIIFVADHLYSLVNYKCYGNLRLGLFYIPTTGSKTACVACSSPMGVLNHIFFNFIAIGESSVDATEKEKILSFS